MNAAFFENGTVFKSFDVCEKVFMMLLNASVASTHTVRTWETIEKEEINIDIKVFLDEVINLTTLINFDTLIIYKLRRAHH